jgi:hypothetical protein
VTNLLRDAKELGKVANVNRFGLLCHGSASYQHYSTLLTILQLAYIV